MRLAPQRRPGPIPTARPQHRSSTTPRSSSTTRRTTRGCRRAALPRSRSRHRQRSRRSTSSRRPTPKAQAAEKRATTAERDLWSKDVDAERRYKAQSRECREARVYWAEQTEEAEETRAAERTQGKRAIVGAKRKRSIGERLDDGEEILLGKGEDAAYDNLENDGDRDGSARVQQRRGASDRPSRGPRGLLEDQLYDQWDAALAAWQKASEKG